MREDDWAICLVLSSAKWDEPGNRKYTAVFTCAPASGHPPGSGRWQSGVLQGWGGQRLPGKGKTTSVVWLINENYKESWSFLSTHWAPGTLPTLTASWESLPVPESLPMSITSLIVFLFLLKEFIRQRERGRTSRGSSRGRRRSRLPAEQGA